MKDSGWRQAWALARLEAGAALSSPRCWVLRYSIAGLFSLVILGTLLAKTGFGSPQPPFQIQELGIFLARLLGFCAYVAAGFWGLFAPSWAMVGAQQSGMLDLLRTSPLSHKQILFSIVGGNLLALGQGFVPVLPLFLLPFYFGGISVIGRAPPQKGINSLIEKLDQLHRGRLIAGLDALHQLRGFGFHSSPSV